MKKSELLSEINDVLVKEREALVSGNIEKLDEILVLKERLLLALQAEETSPEDLSVVRSALGRNQQLLEESMNGIGSIIEKIDRSRQAQTALHTYNQDGEYVCVYSNARGKFERRA